MSPPKDGGPAFPTHGDAFIQTSDGSWAPKSHFGMDGAVGMSVRDWFAGKSIDAARENILAGGLRPRADSIAEESYAIADAMLAESAKGGGA